MYPSHTALYSCVVIHLHSQPANKQILLKNPFPYDLTLYVGHFHPLLRGMLMKWDVLLLLYFFPHHTMIQKFSKLLCARGQSTSPTEKNTSDPFSLFEHNVKVIVSLEKFAVDLTTNKNNAQGWIQHAIDLEGECDSIVTLATINDRWDELFTNYLDEFTKEVRIRDIFHVSYHFYFWCINFLLYQCL
jgi:hypothetical protein